MSRRRLVRFTPLLGLALALSLVAAGNPHDTDNDGKLDACANPGNVTLVTLDGLAAGIDTPSLPLWGDETQADFMLSLEGEPVAENTAAVSVAMTWDLPVEDFDLNLYDGNGTEIGHSENINPIEAAGEEVSGTIKHCEIFTVEALMWTGAGLSTLSLDIQTF